MGLWQSFVEWLRRLFLRKNLEMCMVGLGEAGKTALVNLLATGDFRDNVIPTIGFNMRKIRKGGVVMKVWDLGGQPRFRGMWERYCRGVETIVFVVDAADRAKFSEAASELRSLLQRPSIENIPILIVGNKIDLPDAANPEELSTALHLKSFTDLREVAVFSMSCKTKKSFPAVLEWLSQHAHY